GKAGQADRYEGERTGLRRRANVGRARFGDERRTECLKHRRPCPCAFERGEARRRIYGVDVLSRRSVQDAIIGSSKAEYIPDAHGAHGEAQRGRGGVYLNELI